MSVFVGQVQANSTPESAPGEWMGFGVGICEFLFIVAAKGTKMV